MAKTEPSVRPSAVLRPESEFHQPLPPVYPAVGTGCACGADDQDRTQTSKAWEDAVDQAAHLALPRLRLLFELSRGPANVRSLAAAIGASQNDTSYHLGEMRFRGLVVCENRGTSHIYSLTDSVSIARERGSVELSIRRERCHVVLSVQDLTTELGPREAEPSPATEAPARAPIQPAGVRAPAGRAG